MLPTLQVPDHPEIYVIGDLAHVEQDGHPLLMIATVATQEGNGLPETSCGRLPVAEPQTVSLSRPGYDGGHRSECCRGPFG